MSFRPPGQAGHVLVDEDHDPTTGLDQDRVSKLSRVSSKQSHRSREQMTTESSTVTNSLMWASARRVG